MTFKDIHRLKNESTNCQISRRSDQTEVRNAGLCRLIGLTLGCLFFAMASAQTVHVLLPARTTMDQATSHLEPFMTTAPTKLILPRVDTTGSRFMVVFYTYGHGDPYVYTMILPRADGELLYIDKNYDHDLSNDGPPSFFPRTSNSFKFEIRAREDSSEAAEFLLLRRANMLDTPDSITTQRVDTQGNLTPSFANRVATLLGHPQFKGRMGTFYWDDRLNLRRGVVRIDGKSYLIGLWDCTNDGRFNDDTGIVHDKLLVDVNRTGQLSNYDEASVFKLNSSIPLANRLFRVSSIDKYGRWLDLEPTVEPPTFSFLSLADSSVRFNTTPYPGASRIVSDSLWQLTLRSTTSEDLRLSSYHGRFLLLNFWGEWCKPCLREIPTLVWWTHKYDSSRIQFISLLQTLDLKIAQDVVKKTGINWPQVLLDRDIESAFQIRAYPTNILIFPDGRTAIKIESSLDQDFLGRFLK